MRIALDFGNSNTVIATEDGTIPVLPGVSDPGRGIIPSLIAPDRDGTVLIGQEVVDGGVKDAPTTFRWMKRYIAMNSPYRIRIGGERISATDAALRFLRELIARISNYYQEPVSEIVFTVPVDSYDFYRDWLKSTFETALMRVRIVDEVSAAALSAGLTLGAEEAICLLDIGGSTQQAVVATTIDTPKRDAATLSVRGKAALNRGGADLDRLILSEICRRAGFVLTDDEVRPFSAALLTAAEAVKLALSDAMMADFCFPDGFPLDRFGISDQCISIHRAEFETLMSESRFLPDLRAMLVSALNQADGAGIPRERIRVIGAVGGSGRIPAVQALLRDVFDDAFMSDRVFLDTEPMTAVALGALKVGSSRVVLHDMITHQYAIRYRRAGQDDPRFETIVPALTRVPTNGVVKVLRLKATRQGQQRFGLAIYERRERFDGDTGSDRDGALGGDPYELLFDENGNVRILERFERDDEGDVFLNSQASRFIEANPPADLGETRFEVQFSVDRDRFLRVSAVDLRDGRTVLDDEAVVRLL